MKIENQIFYLANYIFQILFARGEGFVNEKKITMKSDREVRDLKLNLKLNQRYCDMLQRSTRC